MRKKLLTHLFLFVLLLFPNFVSAQMFSVGNENEQGSNPFAPYVRAGIMPVHFSYTGEPAALTNGNSLGFSGTVAHGAFESGGFNLSASLGGEWTGLENRNYFDLNLKFTNSFYLLRKENFGAGIPIQLGTKITNVRRGDISDEFSQTNIHAGVGAVAQLFFPDKFGITAQFLPGIGFSSASGGLIGGNVFSMQGKARINLYNLIFSRNISLGYDYIFDSYNIDGEEFDYDLSGHALTIGVSL